MLDWYENLSVEMVQAHSENGLDMSVYDLKENVRTVKASYWVRRDTHLNIWLLCVLDGCVFHVRQGQAILVWDTRQVVFHNSITWRPVDKDGCPVDIQV